MASPAEIANDLRARAKMFDGRHLQGRALADDARAMRRAAEALDALRLELEVTRQHLKEVSEEAEAMAQKYQDHFYAEDIHGAS